MRTIQKTISLEPMTSRLPGVLPAYKDNVLYYFDEKALEAREYEFTSNYGMIPVNIMLNEAPSAVTDWNTVKLDYDSHCYATTFGTDKECYEEPFYDEFGKFTLSWEELSDWYKFFTDYYHLLNDWGHCGIVYSSATHYYSAESKHGYASQLRYGADEQTYIDMDESFNSRGGKVSLTTCTATATTKVGNVVNYKCNFDKCSAHTIISEAVDSGFYNWICEHIIPSFVIPNQYKDYWRRDKLFYPDVIKWRGWLNDRSGYGGSTEKPLDILQCSASTDCCECEKWFKLGGNDILEQMNTWYDAIQENIIKSIENENCAIPTIITPLSMQVSIDDLGEFSIFSKDYELGIDYRTVKTETGNTGTIIHYESGNTHSGTVVTMNGEGMLLVTGEGFQYDEKYMEKYVSRCNNDKCGYEGYFTHKCPRCGGSDVTVIGWKSYNPELEQVACSFEEYDYAFREDNSGYTTGGTRTSYPQGNLFYYTFDSDDIRVVGANENDLREKLAIKYPIEKRDAILIGTALYDVQKQEYGIYDGSNKYISGKTFFVYRDEYTDVPYTIINGRTIYADFYPFSGACSQFYYFPFFKEKEVTNNDSTCSASTFNPSVYKKFPRTSTTIEDYKEFITYMGSQHIVANSGVTINGSDYTRIVSGTCETPDGLLYVTTGETAGTSKMYHYDDGDVDEFEEAYEKYSALTDSFELQKKVDDDINVYVGGILTGNSASKIYDLRCTSLLSDDIGNTIEALYEIGKECYNHQPPEGSKLEPIYQVGNVANVNRFSMTTQKQEDLVPNMPNYFVGDIITKMVFYYKDIDGHKIDGTCISADKAENGKYTSLSAITKSTEEKDRIEREMAANPSPDNFMFDEDIYCDVTYYVGATLQRASENKSFEIAKNVIGTKPKTFSSGICYTETVKFVEKEVQYYLKTDVRKQIPMTQNTVSAHTLSYPVTCYIMEQEQTKITSDFNNYYYAALAHFEMPLKTNTTDFTRYNGTQILPVFREEYKMGTACIQNVDSDIYIDRGINAAFEKHLKLGEITSIEALEQYTNGYFKIMNN